MTVFQGFRYPTVTLWPQRLEGTKKKIREESLLRRLLEFAVFLESLWLGG
jgi:hypothetical protein